MRKTRIKGWYEFTRAACPICHHTGGCMMQEDGEIVACIRVESKYPFSKNSSLPSYLHYLHGDKRQSKIDTSNVEDIQGEKKKEDDVLDIVYRSLLNQLDLDDRHYLHLTSPNRQLNDRQILLREYRSFPKQPWNVVKAIQQEIDVDDFTGIPGFYLKDGGKSDYWSISGREGILIPYRNPKNQIVGFQYRLDNPPNDVKVIVNKNGLNASVKKQPNIVQVTYEGEIVFEKEMNLKESTTIMYENEILGWVELVKGNRYYWLSSANKPKGTSSGNPAPVHIAVPSSQLANWQPGVLHKAKTVWLSEGPLKCDIAADCIEKLYDPVELEDIGTTFIALPGANSWRIAFPIMKEMGVEQVNICLDADAARNPYVKNHLLELARELKAQNYRANMILWSESDGKGIDDLLLNNFLPHIKRLF